MAIRLALLGFHHETNTFAARPTTYADLVADGVLRGAEIVRRHADAQSTVAGFLAAGQRGGVDVVPLYYATAPPSGLIERRTFARITQELLEPLRTCGPWDGVLLALHGAAVADGTPDADGALAARVRAAVGPHLPIGLALDLHANLTPQLVEAATVTVLYRTNPHLDARQRAVECAELVVRTVRGEIRPAQALATPPLVINIVAQQTAEEPMRGLMLTVEAVMRRPGMLTASFAEGYPYADVAEMGAAAVAVHDGDPAAARTAADDLARLAWERRAAFAASLPTPAEALRRAMQAPLGPVVLLDVGDNIGGGASGDSTVLLAEARRLGVRRYLQTLYDPEAVATCVAAGPGATVTLPVGGKTPDSPHPPVEMTGQVRRIAAGAFEDPAPTHGGWRFFDGGPTVVLETPEEQTLVLTSRVIGNTSIQQMYTLGIRPEQQQVVVAKGVHSPRPAYAPIAAELIMVDTPGVTAANLQRFTYRQRRRPLYPFEAEAAYESQSELERSEPQDSMRH
jgi:microcystin degradation protein MlrC